MQPRTITLKYASSPCTDPRRFVASWIADLPICRTKSGKMQRSMTMSENVFLIFELAQSNLSNVCFISLRETPFVLIVCHCRVQTLEREDSNQRLESAYPSDRRFQKSKRLWLERRCALIRSFAGSVFLKRNWVSFPSVFIYYLLWWSQLSIT